MSSDISEDDDKVSAIELEHNGCIGHFTSETVMSYDNITKVIDAQIVLLGNDSNAREVKVEHAENVRGDSGVIPDASSLAGKPSVFSEGLGPDGVSVRTGVTGRSPGSRSGSGGTGETSSFSEDGPTLVHRFYPDKFGDHTPPSWFVKRCSRETAENVLRNADRLGYGNTLMRKSTSQINNGSYSISKLIRDKRTGVVSFEHYEVIRVAGGYKVNVENEHNPMICLDDVMKYFQQTCGGGTMPLKTNDFRSLQLFASQPNNYTKFPRRHISMATQETGLAEPEPESMPPSKPHIGKSFATGTTASYVIEDPETHQLPIAPPPPRLPTESLPPPKPHIGKSFSTGTTASYVIEDPETHHLPIEPPPPRHPIGSPASSETKSLRSSQSLNTPPHSSAQKVDTTHISKLQQNLVSVTLRKTPSNQLQQNQEAQPRSIVSLSVAITSPRFPHSPNNFPQWNTQKKSPMSEKPGGSSPSETSSSENGSDSGTTSTGSDSNATSDTEVDVHKPGEVGTLRRKFEVKPETSGLPTVTKKGKRVQFEPTRHNSIDTSASEENSAFNTARNRRQSEPSVNASDKIHSKFEGLSVAFKNQLENLMKGATIPSMPKQRPSALVLSPSKPPTPSSGKPRSRFDKPLPPVPMD